MKGVRGFQKGNQLGKGNAGNTYGKANKGRKAPWAKPPIHYGKQNNRWNNGTYKGNGYVWVLNPDHPDAHVNGYIGRHRLIAEMCIGRRLTKREVVHHIDGNKSNDSPDNLYLFLESIIHVAYHTLFNNLPSLINPIVTSNLPTPSPEAMEQVEYLLSIR